MTAGRRSLASRLSAPRLALGLMLYIGVFSFFGTLVPQGDLTSTRVIQWASSHGSLEPLARVLGLHSAFSQPAFIAPVALLAVSTVLCAWQRTKVGSRRFATLLALRWGRVEDGNLGESFTVEAAGLDTDAAVGISQRSLEALGLRPRRSAGYVVTASNPVFALGSPVFHWSLVALMVVLAMGGLYRASGLLGVPVGERLPISAHSFRTLAQGPLHIWAARPLLLGVDGFELHHDAGGIDRGPTPTVELRSADGSTMLARQAVYPNAPLKHGSLTVHASDYGLAATFALVAPSGSLLGTSSTLMDFDDKAPEGTTPGGLTLSSGSSDAIQVATTVPLSRNGGAVGRELPSAPVVRVRLTAMSDSSLVSSATVRVGESVGLPDGGRLTLQGLTYYARLSVVDDPTIPALYATLLLCLLSVAVALLGDQRAVVVQTREGERGTVIAVAVRNWRAGPPSSGQIQAELERRIAAEENRGAVG